MLAVLTTTQKALVCFVLVVVVVVGGHGAGVGDKRGMLSDTER